MTCSLRNLRSDHPVKFLSVKFITEPFFCPQSRWGQNMILERFIWVHFLGVYLGVCFAPRRVHDYYYCHCLFVNPLIFIKHLLCFRLCSHPGEQNYQIPLISMSLPFMFYSFGETHLRQPGSLLPLRRKPPGKMPLGVGQLTRELAYFCILHLVWENETGSFGIIHS